MEKIKINSEMRSTLWIAAKDKRLTSTPDHALLKVLGAHNAVDIPLERSMILDCLQSLYHGYLTQDHFLVTARLCKRCFVKEFRTVKRGRR